MEFLLGNPFSTPVGHCIERATDGSLQNEDWTLNMEICDIINETEDGPKDAIRAMKKRLNGNRNYREVMLALTVLETCVKNCGHRFHALVTSRDFVDGVLVKIISPKNNPPRIVQDKVLALIQAWADAFRSSPDLTGVVQVYEELKRKGIEFPTSELETLSPIRTPQRTASAPEGDSTLLKYGNITSQPTSQTIPPAYTTPQVPNIHASGAINPTPEQVEYERFRTGRSSAQSVNNGVLSEATEDNLIDLGPGSPAVVSNMVNAASTNLPSTNVVGPSSPATLASRLAGLDMGADSVSSTLSSLSSGKPPPTQDDFDVFAQTRTGVLSTPAHTNTTAEDTTSGPPPTLDVLQPAPGAGVDRQNSVMDDIEQWLCTDVIGDEVEEGVTSEEFDKFLEERAKAAEVTPSLPSPPSGDPGTTQGTPNRKKPARQEDGLLAMLDWLTLTRSKPTLTSFSGCLWAPHQELPYWSLGMASSHNMAPHILPQPLERLFPDRKKVGCVCDSRLERSGTQKPSWTQHVLSLHTKSCWNSTFQVIIKKSK
ncbi:hypothetical protein fugu_001110 [Takifugu bimaculatus]|uniref:VHS domain-containing protein n=1 Tax=Takifugu bimaculatus TaxID=433685 RepID=A0A4Z2CIS9_9TELE|nr:hypothetical protein fugu_001110 [Takifugu bimaculatus]